jgi:hypothetical protein
VVVQAKFRPGGVEYRGDQCALQLACRSGQGVIVVGELTVHHYRAEDAAAKAYAMVFLVESAFAQQMDVARAGAGQRWVSKGVWIACAFRLDFRLALLR